MRRCRNYTVVRTHIYTELIQTFIEAKEIRLYNVKRELTNTEVIVINGKQTFNFCNITNLQ